MTKTETAKIMAILKSAYPMYYKNEDISAAVETWYLFFKDEKCDNISEVVMDFISANTTSFPPNIGQIKEANKRLNDRSVLRGINFETLTEEEFQRMDYIRQAEYEDAAKYLLNSPKLSSFAKSFFAQKELERKNERTERLMIAEKTEEAKP